MTTLWSRSLPCLAGTLLLSCRTVPAELPDTRSEPAANRAKVFVESQPEGQSRDSGEWPWTGEDVAQLYRCWFRSPYEYMFRYEDEPLELDGSQHGMFMAGVHGILYYGDLNTCAGELTGQPPRSYADIAPIEALAGVPATVPAPNLEFAAVNPEFIFYARRNLLPHPQQSIDGVAVQLAYDRVFRRFFRLMAASLMMLLESRDLDGETRQYLADTSAGQDGIAWLEGQYGGRIPGFDGSWDGTTMTPPMAAGFWLRRRADGSFAAAWHGLRDVLERYDAYWLADQRSQSPRAAAALDQLPDPMGTAP